MRVHESVAVGARLGNRADFDAIVRSYERPLYGLAASELGGAEAEDAVQEIFLKAYLGIGRLREAGKLESWLYTIARNEVRSRLRSRQAEPERADVDPELIASPKAAAGGSGGDWAALLASLSPEQAEVVRLRYRCDLSVREVALVAGISEGKAKSRLWEATKRLRVAASGSDGLEPPPGLEEEIMNGVEEYRNAGAVFERLGLDAQLRLAIAARKGERWGEEVLAAIGRVKGGAEFVDAFGATISMRELAEVVNCSDRFTEKRLIDELGTVDPETAEDIKRQMFVFEDFSLFDEKATRLLFSEVDRETLALCLAGIERSVRDRILSRIEPEERALVEKAIRGSDPEPSRVRAAQEAAVAWAYHADKAGRFRSLDRSSMPEGAPYFTIA